MNYNNNMNHENNLEKKCVRKVFPELFGKDHKKCSAAGPCDGYDKFCPDYIPSSELSEGEIADYIRNLNYERDKRLN